ncbi:MAG: P-loop NTPase [Micromonosporaceae bacterium]
MERSSQPESFELSDYAAVIRRRWKIVVFASALGLAAAIAYTTLAPKTYVATASVFVSGATPGATQIVNGRTTSAVDLDTEAQIVQSATVGTLARQTLHSNLSATKLVKSVSVTVPPNSQILEINCGARKPAAAAQCATAFAQAYLQNRSNATTTGIKSQLTGLQQQVNSLEQKIATVTTRMRSFARGSRKRINASTELTMYNNRLTSWSNHIANLMAQLTNVSGGRILTDAAAPHSPSSPQRKLAWPSGLAAGLVAGLVIAYWRYKSDKRVRTARDVETLLDLPVLLELPEVKGRVPVALASPASRTGQAFAELAHSLTATLGQGNHVVLVASTSAGNGGSLTAVNLAAAVARTGSEVALVCADLKGSAAPQMFGLGQSPGLAEVMLDRARVGETEQRPDGVPGLRVIGPGAEGRATAGALRRDTAERVVNRLHAVARYVVFEAPPTASGADADALAQLVDAAVVVVEVPRTLRDEVREGVRHLDRMGVAVLGAVVLPALGKPARTAVPDRAAETAKAPGKDRQPSQHATSVASRDGEPDDYLVFSPRGGSEPGTDGGDITATVKPRLPHPLTDKDGAVADGAPGGIARG